MEAKETDFEYAQPKEVVEGQVDGIAGGIMDLLDSSDPNNSGEAVSRPATEEEQAPKGAEAAEEAPPAEKPTENEQEKEEQRLGYMRHADYTQKTQALAQERDQLAGVQGLATLLRNDPVKAAQIAAIISGQTPQQQPTKPTFDDPIEQLKWETKQEALADFRKEMQQTIGPLQQTQVAHARQQGLNQVKLQVQADPDYREIHQQIIDMVASQPPVLQKALYLQLDQDPATYVETFQHFKNQKATALKPDAIAKVVKKETKAPFLDAGGVAEVDGIVGKESAQRLSKQKASALRSGDPMAIADWLQNSGAIDHLY